MKIFVVTAAFLLGSFAALHQFRVNFRLEGQAEPESHISPFVLLSMAAFMLGTLAVPDSGYGLLVAAVLPTLSAMTLLTSSLWEYKSVAGFVFGLIAVNILSAMYLTSCGIGLTVYHETIFTSVTVVSSIMAVSFFIAGIYRRARSVKQVMRTGTVWANVGLGTDAVYMLFLMSLILAYRCAAGMSGFFFHLISGCTVLMLALEAAALAMRVADDSFFVLWRKQEQRIVESMKVTHVEAATDVSKIDEVYKDIYERVVAYFEREKPFLDCELTINDLVKVLYSNKLYISRAISQFTGRNFCQFVNFYRIKYSTECFRANHDLKIHEIASMSGFNSIVSFNMAFRLYMGENPSDWCRKEKGRFVKGQK